MRGKRNNIRCYVPHMVFIRKTLSSGDRLESLGQCIGPLIFLREDVARYRGVVIHEQRHVLQFWWAITATFSMLKLIEFSLGDNFNDIYFVLIALLLSLWSGSLDAVRRWKEIDAFKTELKYFCYDGEIAIQLASNLSGNYFPGYSFGYFYTKLATGTPLESRIDAICRIDTGVCSTDSVAN